MRPWLPALPLCTLSAAASAGSEHDDVPIYEGTWTVRVHDRRVATLVVEDWTGAWQERGAKAGAACGGRKLPEGDQADEEAERTLR